MNKIVFLCCIALQWCDAFGVCPSWPTGERFIVSGSEVTDHKTGLTWSRCSLGQEWSGNTCTGIASIFTHEEAMQFAASKTGWRIPNIKELSSLVDTGCESPAIDSTAFPGTPVWWYWASSPAVWSADYSWGVDFKDGYISFVSRSRSAGSRVRLVRTD